MKIVADLHIHSKYSRAVSPDMTLPEIERWCRLKGIDLVATGDWTHPVWLMAIKNELKETSQGIYSLKDNTKTDGASQHKGGPEARFILSTEISSIYSQGGKTRRVHNLVLSPSIESCEKINKELIRRGCNLMSDGRPIIGMSSVDLLETVLSVDDRALFIPCHIWTPWYSLYGSKSGFDSINKSFGDHSDNIYAVETGLSSDPIMNWQVKDLDRRSIVSSSDAHSGPKLGREATVFVPATTQFNNSTAASFTYNDIADALKQTPNGKLKIGYTIEFFPEEGKYHYSGHRSCSVSYGAGQIKEKGTICPVCRRTLTLGVEYRVLQLSGKLLSAGDLVFEKDRTGKTFVFDKEKNRRPFVSTIPLLEVLAEINGHSAASAEREYVRLTERTTEFDLLLEKTYEEIEAAGGVKLREAIKIVRERKVSVEPGYDGVFGKVKIFNVNNETVKKESENQQTLF